MNLYTVETAHGKLEACNYTTAVHACLGAIRAGTTTYARMVDDSTREVVNIFYRSTLDLTTVAND